VTSNRQRPRRTGTLTDQQAALLIQQFTAQADRITEIIAMLTAYANAGGRDWPTYERVLDHLAREGMKLVQYGRAPLDPELQERAFAAVAAAAGRAGGGQDGRAAIQQKLAGSILATVYYAGWHHLVAPEDWPEALAAVVLNAVRRAPGINDDPAMRALTDTSR
jgi:hypothetical protein